MNIGEILAPIDCFLAAGKPLLESNHESINVKIFESRNEFIDQLNAIQCALCDLGSRIKRISDIAIDAHTRELAAMSHLLGKSKDDGADDVRPWTLVTKKRNDRSTKKVQITDALHIKAHAVSTFDEVLQDGELYYITNADHFAIRLAGNLFHGNIGNIYTDEKNPEKIKDCKFATACMKQNKCDYYHNPVHFRGSTDHRNFIASSWLYAPPNSTYKNRMGSRRIGSRDHLDTDIVDLRQDEIDRFNDQVMHDLLCAILIHSYKGV